MAEACVSLWVDAAQTVELRPKQRKRSRPEVLEV